MANFLQVEHDSPSSTPFSAPEPTPEGEYESRIANLSTTPAQCTTEYFSWRHLTDLSEKVPELVEQFGSITATLMGDYVVLGTDSGAIVVGDYLGRVKAVLRSQATTAYGSVSALVFSADLLAIVAGYSQGHVVVWDWAKGTTVSVSRPVQPGDSPDTVGHPLGTAITSVGFIGKSKHRFFSSSASGHVLYHHIVRRLITTMSTVWLAAPENGTSILFEVASLECGAYESALDDIGLVAVLTSAHLTVLKTHHGVEQQFRLSYQQKQKQWHSNSADMLKRKYSNRPYAGSVAWLPALKHRRPATATDPAESEYAQPMLAFSWGSDLHVLSVQPDYEVAANGEAMGGSVSRVKFEREVEWTAVEDVALCRWIDAETIVYMTQSQRIFVLEIEQLQETEICRSPPSYIAGQPWTTLATGIEAEPSYAQAMSVYKRRVFALCGAAAVYTGRLLTWTERLGLLVEQGNFIDAITLAAGFYQARTGQVVVGLPRSRRVGDKSAKRREQVVGKKVVELMHSALERAIAGAADQHITDASIRALASVCVEACLAIDNERFLFGDLFDHYQSEPARLRMFLEVIEPFILSGQIERLPPQTLNAMVDSYATTPQLVRRLGEILMSLRLSPGEFDIDRVLSTCRRHHLWRTFARVWLSMGDPIAPITSTIAAAKASARRGSGDSPAPDVADTQVTAASTSSLVFFGDETAEAVVFDYLDMVIRGRYYPDGKAILPQQRAEKYSALISEQLFPPIDTSQPPKDIEGVFATLLALAELSTDRLLGLLKHVLNDPFMDYINIIVKPTSGLASRGSERSLRRASQVKSFLQIVVDTIFMLTRAVYLDECAALTRRQVGQLSSFAITLYTTRFPLVFLKDKTVAEWADLLLHLDDASTRSEREHAFEALLRLNPPQSPAVYIDSARAAGFFRVLEHIYLAQGEYELALCTYLEHPDYAYHRSVFPAIKEVAASADAGALAGAAQFVRRHARELADTDAESLAEAVEAMAALEHSTLIDALAEHQQSQFAYLRALLDPTPDALARSPQLHTHAPSAALALSSGDERLPPDIGLSEEQHIVVYPLLSLVPNSAKRTSKYPQKYHERYLELMCTYSPGSVLRYLTQNADLSPEPFRLSYVRTICTERNVSDGLVWALVRLGDFSGALQTLLGQADKEIEIIRAAVPVPADGLAPELPVVLGEVDRERLVEHLGAAARNIVSCIDVCRSAQSKLAKDMASPPPPANRRLEHHGKDNYRSMVSSQLCGLWLALLQQTLGYLHTTNRTLDALPGTIALAQTREAWQLVLKRQRWMLQGVLDALIFAASPASSFISLRSIIQQLIASGTSSSAAKTGAGRSLDIAEMQHLLGVAVGAYKTEAQLMALTNVLVDYDLFTTFGQLLRSQKQGWRLAPTSETPPASLSTGRQVLLGKRDCDDLCCNDCGEQLFVDQRRSRCLADWRSQMDQYFESNALRVLDLHVFEDKDAQLQWLKLRTASVAHDKFLTSSAAASASAAAAHSEQRQIVLFKCGHAYHRQCLVAASSAVESHRAQSLPECRLCAGWERDSDGLQSPRHTDDLQKQQVAVVEAL
ncbi:hypothetical protein EV175_001825 [Coemansia sp. RSA 1933]|nr:hypothetical protein EV175_001825 [Coemansia sp. RSA 1933]